LALGVKLPVVRRESNASLARRGQPGLGLALIETD